MPDEQKQPSRVGCRHPGGLMINRPSLGYDDGTGQKQMGGHNGPGVRLNGPSQAMTAGGVNSTGLNPKDLPFGITEVSGDWDFPKWLQANQLNPLVTSGTIFLIDDQSIDPAHRTLDPNASA